MKKISPASIADIHKRGIRDGIGVPALSLGFSMFGFASIAREAGFDALKTITTTALVWGLPGQVAAVSLYLAGASLLAVVTAVALANMRMLLMTISAMEMLGLKDRPIGFLKKLGLMQLIAITSWVQLGQAEGHYSKEKLYHYYIAMALTVYTFGMSGTVLGYYASTLLPKDVLVAVLVMTPMYILLMVINARQIVHRYAGVFGGILCPLTFPVIGEWGILLGGIAGGTMALLLKKKTGLMEKRK